MGMMMRRMGTPIAMLMGMARERAKGKERREGKGEGWEKGKGNERRYCEDKVSNNGVIEEDVVEQMSGS